MGLKSFLSGVVIAVIVVSVAWFFLAGARGGLTDEGFQKWADPLRDQGIEVSIDRISGSRDGSVLRDLVIGNSSEGWSWTAPQVQVTGSLGGEGLVLRVAGTQEIRYRIAGQEHTLQISARIFQVTLEKSGGDGSIGVIKTGAIDLEIERPERPTITTGRIEVRLILNNGKGLVPDGSILSLGFDDLVLPGYENSAFGATIQRIFAVTELQRGLNGLNPEKEIAEWQAAPNALARITSSGLTWGLLAIEAAGTLRLDNQYRPVGTLNGVVRDILPAVEALTAAGVVAPQENNDFRTGVFEDLNAIGPATFAMAVRIRDGNVALREDEVGLPVINIGTVGPLLGMPPRL